MTLNDCHFSLLTKELHDQLSDFRCVREPDIEKFFQDECVLNDSQLLSSTYCFYLPEAMKAVAGFCILCSDISTSAIPKKMRNKLNRKIPYVKQRDQYPAILIGQLAVFDPFTAYHLGNELMENIKAWLAGLVRNIAARYIIVDAVNDVHVLDYYLRNKFSFVFQNELDEREALELDETEPLKTRFMLCDLKPTYDMLRDSATFEI